MALHRKFSHHLPYITFIVVLLACSAFFTYQVEGFRARVSKARLTGVIASGTQAQVVNVVDGDELVVKTAEDSGFVIRILGIKSFDPVAAEPAVGAVGLQARHYLLDTLEGRTVTIEFDEFAKDPRGRLLAFVRLGNDDGDGGNGGSDGGIDGIDIGADMVQRGLTLTYTRFPFARSAQYLELQADAERASRGLWALPKAAQRARALMESWHAERQP